MKKGIVSCWLGLWFLVIILCLISAPTYSTGAMVTDMIGREIQVPERAERIISSYRPATHFIFALGAQENLVVYESGRPSRALLEQIYPAIAELPSFSGTLINLEEVMALDPDLVILSPHGDGPQMASRLKANGITAAVINPESYDSILDTVDLLGILLGREEKAAEIRKFGEAILQIANRTKDIPASDRKSVYFSSGNFLDTVGEGLLQTEMIYLAGGENIAAVGGSGFLQFSIEELLRFDPDIVFISQFFREDMEELKKDPRYSALKAFRENQIYQFPSSLEPWDFPTPAALLGVVWMAQTLHPELFFDLDLLEIVESFYELLYGKGYSQLGGAL